MRYSSSLTSLRTSSASSSSGEPVGHETPDTSAVNTPGWDSSLQMGPINNKRKRSSAPSPCVVNDTDLVMLLQDEECAGPSHIRSNHSSNSVRVSIDLTAASESEPLSPPISVSSFFFGLLQANKLWRPLRLKGYWGIDLNNFAVPLSKLLVLAISRRLEAVTNTLEPTSPSVITLQNFVLP